MTVFGIGEKKTPDPFIVSFDKFIYLEILKKNHVGETYVTQKNGKDKVDTITTKVIERMLFAISDVEDEEGWAFLGEVGKPMQKKQPNFDPRNYGFRKLKPLVKSLDQVEMVSRKNLKGSGNLIYVRTRS